MRLVSVTGGPCDSYLRAEAFGLATGSFAHGNAVGPATGRRVPPARRTLVCGASLSARGRRPVPRSRRGSRGRVDAERPLQQRRYRHCLGSVRRRGPRTRFPHAARGPLPRLGGRRQLRDPLAQGPCGRTEQPSRTRRRHRDVERRADALGQCATPTRPAVHGYSACRGA